MLVASTIPHRLSSTLIPSSPSLVHFAHLKTAPEGLPFPHCLLRSCRRVIQDYVAICGVGWRRRRNILSLPEISTTTKGNITRISPLTVLSTPDDQKLPPSKNEKTPCDQKLPTMENSPMKSSRPLKNPNDDKQARDSSPPSSLPCYLFCYPPSPVHFPRPQTLSIAVFLATGTSRRSPPLPVPMRTSPLLRLPESPYTHIICWSHYLPPTPADTS